MKVTLRVMVCALACAVGVLAQLAPLKIYWIDVEGGAATLIVTPAKESILIDAGEAVQRDALRIHDVAAHAAGLKQIDYMVTTHWHSDHFGGVYGLSKLIPIRHFYANRKLPDTLPDKQYTPYEVLKRQYQSIVPNGPVILEPGDGLPLQQAEGAQKVAIRCVASYQKVLAGTGVRNPNCKEVPDAPLDTSENLNSLVLVLEYGKFTFFDSGDLTKNMERKLVCPVNLIGNVVLYQIAHHGLDQSNDAMMISSLHPKVVVVNNSAVKGAEPATMETLRVTPSIETVWQLQRNTQASKGWNTPDQYIANPNGTVDSAQFIVCSVNDNGTFSVQIGTNGTKKDYRASR